MKKRYGLLVDIDYCVGCGICVIACKLENGLAPSYKNMREAKGASWNQVISVSDGIYPNLSIYTVPSHCNHCKDAPCIPSCPKEAIYKRMDGITLIAKDKCNACEDQPGQIKLCMPACPYGAIQFNEKQKAAEVCTFCVHRIEVGQEPACVRACLGRCLTFGDFNDPKSEVSQKAKKAGKRLFVFQAEKKTHPAVKYIAPKGAGISLLAKVKPIYGYGSEFTKPTM